MGDPTLRFLLLLSWKECVAAGEEELSSSDGCLIIGMFEGWGSRGKKAHKLSVEVAVCVGSLAFVIPCPEQERHESPAVDKGR